MARRREALDATELFDHQEDRADYINILPSAKKHAATGASRFEQSRLFGTRLRLCYILNIAHFHFLSLSMTLPSNNASGFALRSCHRVWRELTASPWRLSLFSRNATYATLWPIIRETSPFQFLDSRYIYESSP